MTPTHILTLLLCLCLVAPVSAVTYSEEYYEIGDNTTQLYDKFVASRSIFTIDAGGLASVGSFLELRRQTILIEKQNELLERQLNSTLVCTKPGPNYCSAYRWVIP